MKKAICLILSLAALLGLSACAASEEARFTPDYESAIGVIFVNDGQVLPENEKVYADYADHNYTFDLDAACLYYFDANAEESYAGDQNFTYLTFSADIDDQTTGAEGTIAYHQEEGAANSITAYYIYHDETGIYFDTGTSFDTVQITDGCTVKGIDYPCSVTFMLWEPAASFTITELDGENNAITTADYTPADVTDYQAFTMSGETRSAEIVSYGADGSELGRQIITPENNTAVICFEEKGQILANKILRFSWDE